MVKVNHVDTMEEDSYDIYYCCNLTESEKEQIEEEIGYLINIDYNKLDDVFIILVNYEYDEARIITDKEAIDIIGYKPEEWE